MPERLRCLIVDDEPLARERLRLLLGESGAPVEVVGEAATGAEALERTAALAPDVLFLDIEMPGLDGFDVVDLLDPAARPAVVFVTAYDAYAVRAFDVAAADYLTKPVRPARLRETLARLRTPADRRDADRRLDALLDAPPPAPGAPPLERLTLSTGQHLWVLGADDILRFEAEQKLTVAVPFPHADPTRGRLASGRLRATVDFTLDALEARLDAARFLRVHRSVIVNARAVRELVPWFSGTYRIRLADGAEVPLARRRVAAVRALLGG
jgi:two-component system LytT family response regulator